jgi:hypothetical protein
MLASLTPQNIRGLRDRSRLAKHSAGFRPYDNPQCRGRHGIFVIGQLVLDSAECSDVFPFMTFHLSFFQINFRSYLAYLISDISRDFSCIISLGWGGFKAPQHVYQP